MCLARVQQEYLQPRKGLDEVDDCRRRMGRFDAERNDQVSEVRVKAGALCRRVHVTKTALLSPGGWATATQ